MSDWPSVVSALIAALTGGTALKLIESWLGRSKVKTEQDKQFRDELRVQAVDLRKQIDELKDELKKAEEEMDEWKLKYWDIYVQYNEFRLKVFSALISKGLNPEEVLLEGKKG